MKSIISSGHTLLHRDTDYSGEVDTAIMQVGQFRYQYPTKQAQILGIFCQYLKLPNINHYTTQSILLLQPARGESCDILQGLAIKYIHAQGL